MAGTVGLGTVGGCLDAITGGSRGTTGTGGGRPRRLAKLVPDDGDGGDRFGASLALSADGATALVGAARDEDPNGVDAGSAYVFGRTDGEWRQRTKLLPDDGDGGDRFGKSVAISGEGATAVVGAWGNEDPNGETAGSAYAFRFDGEWRQDAVLAPGDGNVDDQFGYSVSLSGGGDTVLVGARRDEDPNGERAGSAYVFRRTGREYSETAKLAPDDGDDGDLFGWSVALSGDGATALVGAASDEDPNGQFSGSAFVFARSGDGWREAAKLAPEDGDVADGFGKAVALSSDGTVALVGSPEAANPDAPDGGAAYAFRRSDGEWRHGGKIVPGDGDGGDLFGSSVTLSADGTTAIVDALHDEDPNGKRGGSTGVFRRTDGEWRHRASFAPDDGDEGDLFGHSVALSDDAGSALVGALRDEDPNGSGAGAAYVYAP